MVDVTIGAAHAPDLAVVEGVNWTVAAGEFWIVGGAAGSGKSDLLATAAGLLRPIQGALRVFGKELHGLAEEDLIQHRRRVGIVFGNEGRLFSQLTVAENLALPLCYHQNCDPTEVRERVETILDHTGLLEVANRLPAGVNRSLRVRIALARSLALQPELLLLDDPMRGSDPAQRRWWIEFLASLCAGHAVLDNRRATIVVAADDFRSWIVPGEKFALIAGSRWLTIGGKSELADCREPVLRELVQA